MAPCPQKRNSSCRQTLVMLNPSLPTPPRPFPICNWRRRKQIQSIWRSQETFPSSFICEQTHFIIMLLAVYTIHLSLYANKSGCSWSSTHDSAKVIGLIPRGYTNLLKVFFFLVKKYPLILAIFSMSCSFNFVIFSATKMLTWLKRN